MSKNIRDIGAPGTAVAFPVLNSILKLSGRSSGLRSVKVTTINATVDVGYPGCGVARFVSQAITSPVTGASASRPGDSGSPVTTAGRAARGLKFAGDGFFGIINLIPLVLNALGVQIDTAADAVPVAGQACP